MNQQKEMGKRLMKLDGGAFVTSPSVHLVTDAGVAKCGKKPGINFTHWNQGPEEEITCKRCLEK